MALGALTVAFVLTESTQVHVELRRQTISLSLSELPLVAGLFVVAPLPLLAARLAGVLVVALRRGTASHKLVFNVALFTVEVAVLELMVGDARALLLPSTWWRTLAAVLLATAVSGLLVLLAVRLLQGPVTVVDMVSTLVPMLASAGLNTSFALMVVVLLHRDRQTAFLVAIVAVALFGAYRGYSVLLRRHHSLEQMHDFSVGAAASTSVEDLVGLVLRHSRRLLSAELALLLVPGARLVGSGEVFVLDEDERVRTASPEQAALVRAAAAAGQPIVTSRSSRRRLLGEIAVASTAWRDAVGLPLASDRGEQGFLIVANRLGAMSSLEAADLRLLAVVGVQLAAALQNRSLVARLRQEATHDSLTGLPNRALFHERLEQLTATAAGARGAVLLLDLDGFKDVNDTLGHHNGDALLREVARRLADALPPTVTVARLGGDEFAVLVPAAVCSNDPVLFAQGLQQALRPPCALDGVQIDVRASLGIALFPEHGQHGADLLQRADVAMYAAKQARSPIQVYDPATDHATPRRLALVGELRTAIEAGDLLVHYQPEISLRDGSVVGVEALARWLHPILGQVPPEEFVQIAERTGLIVELTRVVLDQSLAQMRRWLEGGHSFSVSVNVAPRALLAVDFVSEVQRLLVAHGVPAALLTLEVTETSVMTDPDAAISALGRLHDLGVALSVDDFGTGYSSLAYLQRLPVDEVKIDRGFVTALAGDTGNTVIVRAICDLGHSLGLRVVAEGLEDPLSQALLRDLGCDAAQGYLISHPLPVDAFNHWLATTTPDRVVLSQPQVI